MATPKRPQMLAKLHKLLRQHYKLVPANTARPILEQVLFACCLENAPYDQAEKAFSRLGENYFDLNEVRVTTVAELAESLQALPDPSRAALSLRRVLQGVFESTYSFSLEHARKHSIAHGIKTLESLQGVPRFVVSFVVSTGLGGHVIPLDDGALAALWLAGLITQEEYDTRSVPWLDRAVSKKLGAEFSSLLHQFGADVMRNIHSPSVRKIATSVDATAKDRFPKRGLPLPPPNPPAGAGKHGRGAPSEDHRPAGPQAAARPAGKTPLPPPGSGPKRPGDGKPGGKSGPKPFVVKPNMGRPLTIKPERLAVPEPQSTPPAKKKVAAEPRGRGEKQKPGRPGQPVKRAAGGTAKKSGMSRKQESAKQLKKSMPGKKKPLKKVASSSHARQLTRRKPK